MATCISYVTNLAFRYFDKIYYIVQRPRFSFMSSALIPCGTRASATQSSIVNWWISVIANIEGIEKLGPGARAIRWFRSRCPVNAAAVLVQ